MAVTALHTAATGMSALSESINVIANNLANVNTTGFKSFRANLEDLFYDEKRQPGVENAAGDVSPAGTYVGLGARISNTQLNFEQGAAITTNRDLDLMIEGQGFFQVTLLQEQGSGIGYARAGNFFKNADGDLVLGNTQGPRLEPQITIPQDAIKVDVSADGTVNAYIPGQATPQNVGQLNLATFVNPQGLKAIGGNIYLETAASGPPIEGEPGSANFGTISSGMLESSNVDPVKELVDLIKTQRAFEMNSQSIRAADETLQVIGRMAN